MVTKGLDNRCMYEDELDRLEIRISYLEKQNEELNPTVAENTKTNVENEENIDTSSTKIELPIFKLPKGITSDLVSDENL